MNATKPGAEGIEWAAEPGESGSSNGLTAKRLSTTNSSLVMAFGAEVVGVLPNGMPVAQPTRQLTVSKQMQLIQLRGLLRPEDVSSQNQVLSSNMTDLELEEIICIFTERGELHCEERKRIQMQTDLHYRRGW